MSRWPAAIAAFAALSFVTPHAHAAPSKAECVATHEIGQRMWKADKLRKALHYLDQCAVDACPAVIARECVAWRTEAIAELPTVSVRAIASDGRSVVLRSILIDGELVQNPESHAIDPGQHTVIASTEDGLSATTIFVARRGDRSSPVVLRFPDPAPAATPAAAPVQPPPALPPLPLAPTIKYVPVSTRVSPSATPYAWGFAATGAAALASFAWFGLSGRSKERDMERDCAPFCAQSEVDSMHRDYVVADVSLGVGLAALGLSVWIIHAFREPRLPSTSARVDPRGLSFAF